MLRIITSAEQGSNRRSRKPLKSTDTRRNRGSFMNHASCFCCKKLRYTLWCRDHGTADALRVYYHGLSINEIDRPWYYYTANVQHSLVEKRIGFAERTALRDTM